MTWMDMPITKPKRSSFIVRTRVRSLPPTALYTSKATALCSDSSRACQRKRSLHSLVAELIAGIGVGEDELGQGGREVLEGRRGGQVRLRREHPLTDPEPPLDEPFDQLGRVPERVQSVVEGPVLPPVHRLLADEPGHLALERRIGDLVAEVPHRAHEEVLAVGEDR